eukprot:6870171-Lingulodinium_polyedra.AAC.1
MSLTAHPGLQAAARPPASRPLPPPAPRPSPPRAADRSGGRPLCRPRAGRTGAPPRTPYAACG